MGALIAVGALIVLLGLLSVLGSALGAIDDWVKGFKARNLPSDGEVRTRLSAFLNDEVTFGGSRRRSHQLDDLTVAFLRIVLPPANPFRPEEREYLQSRELRRGIPAQIVAIRNLAQSGISAHLDELQKQVSARTMLEAECEKERINQRAIELLDRNEAKVDKFLEVAYRKVATPDAYGDENPKALEDEIRRFIRKLGETEPDLVRAAQALADKRRAEHALRLEPLASAVAEELTARFEAYYRQRKANGPTHDVSSMTGVDFELHIAELLRKAGIGDVSTTPKTGDQGADLLFSQTGKKYVVQAKRYSGSVGNKAVQEAHAAKGYYRCNQALVVTNSLFTPSARALAKELGVLLVDGHHLEDLPNILSRRAE